MRITSFRAALPQHTKNRNDALFSGRLDSSQPLSGDKSSDQISLSSSQQSKFNPNSSAYQSTRIFLQSTGSNGAPRIWKYEQAMIDHMEKRVKLTADEALANQIINDIIEQHPNLKRSASSKLATNLPKPAINLSPEKIEAPASTRSENTPYKLRANIQTPKRFGTD